MKYLLTSLCLIFAFMCSAQVYTMIPWRDGEIVKNGEVLKGKIRLAGDLNAPWLNCEVVYFVPEDAWIEGRNPKKKVIDDYDPEDIESYHTFTVNELRDTIRMDYYTRQVLNKGILKNKLGPGFVRKMIDGPISSYSFVPKPPEDLITTAEERAENKQSALMQTAIYVEKEGEPFMEIVEVDMVDWMSDCPELVQKIKSEAYGFKPKSERKERKGLGKMMARQGLDNSLEDKLIRAVEDYNACQF